ncbi:GNAT family N-acetyltransferase [Actinokineospora bangkokensis]|uniref:GNAT family N-acetyltransferase n=1 Tax=Actinokineospora bangkokensis TaxID=1193682 RepID=A0A1Q9LMZ1_9PSEU|nr:GNAT family N-acetyltransferase [Actinokineospora bangkokensis]OLR93373.1 GNAT family N-acetyltransferase [Actinokineospora bangkokensis]
MGIELGTPDVNGLAVVVGALRDWQYDGPSVHLHPGDLGWFWRFGRQKTAEAVRIWTRGGTVLAMGMLDAPDLLRLTIAPDARQDQELADQLVADLTSPERGVLPGGAVDVEAPMDALLQEALLARGWLPGEPWTPLRRDLATAPERVDLRIETVGPDLAPTRLAVHAASFARSTLTLDGWNAMRAAPTYDDARCLVAFNGDDAVAAVTVWSAGPGKPGLLEPLGVHRDHRGHGYGKAIGIAAASALREMGSSSAVVCTPTSNTAAVATYRAAGYDQLPGVRDLHREA